MLIENIKCHICGTEYEGEQFDECPYCVWGYTGIEHLQEEDEVDSYNCISIEGSRKNLKNGLTIFGDPLPEKRP